MEYRDKTDDQVTVDAAKAIQQLATNAHTNLQVDHISIMSFQKIKVDNPVVDLDGDEMTRSALFCNLIVQIIKTNIYYAIELFGSSLRRR
jgi:hypothetical protein